MWKGTQRAHNAGRAQGIADGLAQAMARADLKIGDRAGRIATDLKRHHHKIGPLQRRTQRRMALNASSGPGRCHQPPHDDLRLGQTLRIDIHQRDIRPPQRGALEDIPENILHKNG